MFLKFFFFFFFLLMENLGAMVYSRYTGFREITDRDVLELHCIHFLFSVYAIGPLCTFFKLLEIFFLLR